MKTKLDYYRMFYETARFRSFSTAAQHLYISQSAISQCMQQLEKDLAYEKGSKAHARDEEYFKKLIEESEPIFNGILGPQLLEAERARTGNPNLRAAVNVSDSVESELDIFHLEAEPTQRLLGRFSFL